MKLTYTTRSKAWPTLTFDTPSLVDDIIIQPADGEGTYPGNSSIMLTFHKFTMTEKTDTLHLKLEGFTDGTKTFAAFMPIWQLLSEVAEAGAMTVELAEVILRSQGVVPDPEYMKGV